MCIFLNTFQEHKTSQQLANRTIALFCPTPPQQKVKKEQKEKEERKKEICTLMCVYVV